MAKVWKCAICLVFLTLSLKALLRHLSVVHANEPNFKIRCVVDGCPKEYVKMNSFRFHLARHHPQDMIGNPEQQQQSPPQLDTEDVVDYDGPLREEPAEPAGFENDDDSSLSETDDIHVHTQEQNYEGQVDDVPNNHHAIDLERCGAQFVMKLQSNSKVSKVAVNNIVQSTSTLIEQVKDSFQSSVIQAIRNTPDAEQLEIQINELFENFEDPFQNLATSSLQRRYINENMNYVAPIEYKLGQRITYQNKGSKRQICEKDETMVYIPILDSIEQLLSNQRIFEMIISHPLECDDDILYDICDGGYFKNSPIFQQHKNALQVILYHDEVEICNPLGSHISTHKVDMYYYTLGNISPKFRSKLCAIRLVAIVRAKLVSKYGQNRVIVPLYNDLQKLANGHTFLINGEAIELFGAVVSCLGDTEGQQQWGGFKVKVGWANQKCRNCLCTFNEMQQHFRNNLFPPRTLMQYRRHCNDIKNAPTAAAKQNLQTTYGITEQSLLSELSNFDIIKQLPQDIMHVLLEGVVQYELRYILETFFNDGFCTLKQLNSVFSGLYLGYNDERNRPPPIRETVFNGDERYKMKQTAEQARIYLKHLPFVLDGYVPQESPHYKLILEIMFIVLMCFSPVICKQRVQELQDAIENHLKHFKELFPGVNVTPKMHYMVHIPEQILHLGPLVRHSCLRFEASHRYFKELAPQQNFKNICLSLAERYQLEDCIRLDQNGRGDNHPLFSNEKEIGPVKKITNDALDRFYQRIAAAELFCNPQAIENVFKAKWLTVHGSKFVPANGCVIAYDASFQTKLPLFGKLGAIWLADEHIVFEFLPLETVFFSKDLMAYKVEEPLVAMSMDLCLHSKLLDYNVYFLQETDNGLYIPLKYDLKDIISMHIVGANPLHRQ